MSEYIIEMRDIVKEYSGIRANDKISIGLKQGEVHALLGENGAGKSTLMSILFGLVEPTEGSIFVKGKKVQIPNPYVAYDHGIGMVHQHFKLVHNLTVTENIILGIEPKKGLSIDIKLAHNKIEELSKRYGLLVDAGAKIEDITVGMQQRVEILKMLYRDAKVLIFDEPSAVLTPAEIKELMQIMRNLIKEGKSIILITHKLKEIKEIADRCTVIRKGKLIKTVDVKATSEKEMAEIMVGREISFFIDKPKKEIGKPVLQVNKISAKNNMGTLGLKDFSLKVHEGEIVGIAGVDGNGQAELIECITGLRQTESGDIYLNGENITKQSISKRIKNGLSHIPEDRQKRGLVLEYTLKENIILEVYGEKPFSKNGFLNETEIDKYASKVLSDYDVRSGSGINSLASSLSGGNQQKAIIGREIEKKNTLLIAVQPTRGLDVGSIEYIHKRIVEQRNLGKAVLLVSLELDEVLQLSDRIVAINSGQVIGEVLAENTNENEVGLMMAGVKKEGE